MAIEPKEINQKLLEELLKLENEAERKMLEKVAKRVKKGITTPGWNEEKLADVQKLRAEITKILNDKEKLEKSYVSAGIKKAYESGVKHVSSKLTKPVTSLSKLVPYHLQRMILETQNAISNTSFQILRNTHDVYRDVIAETTTGVLTGVDTRMQAAQSALDKFAAKGITGFKDKAGRNWELSTYVEMATRTANSRAALQGFVDACVELNHDLMMVSGHSAACPLCEPWSNKVLSISGNNPKYASLESAKAAGLFHPNCKHRLTIWFEDEELMNKEHLEEYKTKPDPKKYNAIQKQRYIERQIRKYKRVEAVAMTPDAKAKARNKILYWQKVQREHVKEWDLRRKYNRERLVGSSKVGPKDTSMPKPIIQSAESKKSTEPKELTPEEKYNKLISSFGYGTEPISNFDEKIEEAAAQVTDMILDEIHFKGKATTPFGTFTHDDYSDDAAITEKVKRYLMGKDEDELILDDKDDDKDDKFDDVIKSTTTGSYSQFKTIEEIDKILNNQSEYYSNVEDDLYYLSEEWKAVVSPQEMNAVINYTGEAFRDINKYFRGLGEVSDSVKRMAKKCEDALKKSVIKKDMVVRRGVDIKGFAGMFSAEDFEEARNIREQWMENNFDTLVGRTCSDKGFLSTSPHKKGGFWEDINLKIDLPKGTQGVYIDDISKHPGEKEFLLQRNMRYVITHVERVADTKKRPEMSEKYTVYMKAILEEE